MDVFFFDFDDLGEFEADNKTATARGLGASKSKGPAGGQEQDQNPPAEPGDPAAGHEAGAGEASAQEPRSKEQKERARDESWASRDSSSTSATVLSVSAEALATVPALQIPAREVAPPARPELTSEALGADGESSCWHSAGTESQPAYHTCGSATPTDMGSWVPRLPRTDTASSLASSWCSDSDTPMTPTSAQTAQDRWTPAPRRLSSSAGDFPAPLPSPSAASAKSPTSAASVAGRVVGFGQQASFSGVTPKAAWPEASARPEDAKQAQQLEREMEAYALRVASKTIQALMPSELVGIISGKDMWHNHGVQRVGIPAIRMTDGPFGARGPTWQGPCSVVTPCGLSLGSSWNPELVKQVGNLLGEEARVKGANILLGPTVNLARVPISGRTFELLGEDPHLTARLAVAYIQGVQAVEGVAACVKHLAVNDQEKNRMFCSAEVSQDVLRALHLKPFEAAVKEGHVMAVMTAYNKVNGTYCSEHKWLLEDVLRKDWGFKGIVMSDWGGTHSTESSLKAGLDIEMPGEESMFYGERLKKLLAEGRVAVADVRKRASTVLKLMVRLGLLSSDDLGLGNCCNPRRRASSMPDPSPASSPGSSPTASPSLSPALKKSVGSGAACCVDPARPKPSPNTREQQELLQRAAAEGTVLLKNRGALPLSKEQSVAVIGPNAASMTMMGGGSAVVLPNRSERSLAAQLRARGMSRVTYERGCAGEGYLPTLGPPLLRSKDGRGVLKGEFFDESARRGAIIGRRLPIARTVLHHLELGNFSGIFFNEPPGKINPDQAWSAHFEGVLTPEVTGPHEFGVFASGSCKVYLDGALLLEAPKDGKPLPIIPMSRLAPEVRTVADLEAGRKYDLLISWVSVKDSPSFPAQCHLGCRLCTWASEEELLERAEEAARASDVAVVCVGTDSWQECEGRDQPSMQLPGRTAELLERVTKANPKTVVCLNVGSPKELHPWIDDAAAVVASWFGGQEAAAGLATVLLGEGHGPSGRLPLTWPKRLEDGPVGRIPGARYPGEAAKVSYTEGLLVGYRWYDSQGIEPDFPFGYGLSYTAFEYIDLCLPDGDSYAAGEPVSAVVTIENVGDRLGMEVVQLYLERSARGEQPVLRELAAFAKVPLAPGDVADVRLQVEAKVLKADRGEPTPAELQICVGSSSAGICLRQRIVVG